MLLSLYISMKMIIIVSSIIANLYAIGKGYP